MEEAAGPDLTAHDLAVLEFEQSWWTVVGAKDTAVRERLAISPTQYHSRIDDLIDQPAAEAAYPLLVRRLRRARSERRRANPPST